MPFENGSFTVGVFELKADLPENLIALFAAKKAGTIDSVTDEPQIGWVTGRHLLDTSIDEASASLGGCYYLQLRKAERKVSSSFLNAMCKREELAYMEANKMDFVPSKAKKAIKEDAMEKLLLRATPSLTSIPVVIDPNAKMVYVGASSATQIDFFIEQFFQTTKLDPIQVGPGFLLEKLCKTAESSFPALSLIDHADDEPVVGRDFLTWLWYFSEGEEKLKLDPYGDFDLMLEGPLTFASGAEARGGGEISIKGGDAPLRSAEAKAALAVGKKLRKAKLTITRANEFWTCTVDADRFVFGSLKLPEGEEMNADERFAERMESLLIFKSAIEGFFGKFSETMLAPDYPAHEKKMRDWASGRDAL